jgi:hypothetical protein
MRMPCRPSRVATVALALALLWSPGLVPAQQATPNQVLIAAVAGNPADAPRLTAQEVAAGAPDSAPSIVSDVVGALPSDQRQSVVPRVVSAAIAALPPPQRAPQAPAIVCAAIRALLAEERDPLVVPIVAAAAAMAPTASPRIVACATDAVPAMAAAIIAAAGLTQIQPEVLSSASAPQPGSSIGRDIQFRAQPQAQQTCASPPCP